MQEILSVSYDITRQHLLETKRYRVTSASTFDECVELCNSRRPFALFILGHSIPKDKKESLIQAFRSKRPRAAVIALSHPWEELVRGADFSIEPTPEVLLSAVTRLLVGRATGAQG